MVKRPRTGSHGGDWTWKIEANPKETETGSKTGSSPTAATFLVYFATDNDGSLQIETKNKNSKVEKIKGQTSGLGEFEIKFNEKSGKIISYFNYNEYLESFNQIHEDAMRRLAGKMTKGIFGIIVYNVGLIGQNRNPGF